MYLAGARSKQLQVKYLALQAACGAHCQKVLQLFRADAAAVYAKCMRRNVLKFMQLMKFTELYQAPEVL